MGKPCYPVIIDYLNKVHEEVKSQEIAKDFGDNFTFPRQRTPDYYNQLIPLTDCLVRLYNPDLERAGKRVSLALIRSVFQVGKADMIKACLDLRIPKHIIHFLQDADSEVRYECIMIFNEISKGLQDDDFEIFARKNKFPLNTTLHFGLDALIRAADKVGGKENRFGETTKQAKRLLDQRVTQQPPTQKDEKKYIDSKDEAQNLGVPDPASKKPFLQELAKCFESPVFIAPFVRLLKS